MPGYGRTTTLDDEDRGIVKVDVFICPRGKALGRADGSALITVGFAGFAIGLVLASAAAAAVSSVLSGL
jgi:hypothetical protein